MKIKFFAAGALLAGTVIAGEGIQVGGNLEQTVKTGDNINVGMGMGVVAEQTIGTIEGNVKVGGNLSQTVKTGDNINVGMGMGAVAKQKIGVISGK